MITSVEMSDYFDLSNHNTHHIACIKGTDGFELRCQDCNETLVHVTTPSIFACMVRVFLQYLKDINEDGYISIDDLHTCPGELFKVWWNDRAQYVVPYKYLDMFHQLMPSKKGAWSGTVTFLGNMYKIYPDLD